MARAFFRWSGLGTRRPVARGRIQEHAGLQIAATDRLRHAFQADQPHLQGIAFQCFDLSHPQDFVSNAGLPPGADLRTGLQRLAPRRGGRLTAVLHGAVTVTAVFLPDALEAIAAGPVVGSPTLAQVGEILTHEALARPRRTRTPGVHAFAALAIVDEAAFVAVAPRPGLNPLAVLEAFAELALILRRP